MAPVTLAAAVAALLALAVWPWTIRRRVVAERGRAPAAVRRPAVEPSTLLDLAAAALGSGASVSGALEALALATTGLGDGQVAADLRRAARALLLGAPWPEATAGASADLTDLFDVLQPAWEDGIDPLPLLARRAATLRAARAQQAQEAAARLGVRLVLPLGLCFLPSFVLLSVVPLVIGSVGDLLR